MFHNPDYKKRQNDITVTYTYMLPSQSNAQVRKHNSEQCGKDVYIPGMQNAGQQPDADLNIYGGSPSISLQNVNYMTGNINSAESVSNADAEANCGDSANHLEREEYDFCNAESGMRLPKYSPVTVNADAKLRFGNIIFDLGSPEVKTALEKVPEGESVSAGRLDTNYIRIPENYEYVSKQHAIIQKTGNKYKITDISLNGTYIQDAGFDVDELVRSKGNNGKIVDKNYIKTSKEVRAFFNERIENKNYVREYSDYADMIDDAHQIAYSGKSNNDFWYKDKKTGGFLEMNPYEYRKDCSINRYPAQSKLVEDIAVYYGDPYRASDENPSKVMLKGISREGLPINKGHSHIYADGKYTEEYFKQMYRTAKEAVDMANNRASVNEFLEKVAEHYQYAANARPYIQINNSLFMNEVNTLLKKAGLNAIPHGMLDHAAQRLQSEAFKKYFKDYYNLTNLSRQSCYENQ